MRRWNPRGDAGLRELLRRANDDPENLPLQREALAALVRAGLIVFVPAGAYPNAYWLGARMWFSFLWSGDYDASDGEVWLGRYWGVHFSSTSDPTQKIFTASSDPHPSVGDAALGTFVRPGPQLDPQAWADGVAKLGIDEAQRRFDTVVERHRAPRRRRRRGGDGPRL